MFWVDLGKNRQFFHKLKFKAFKGSKAIALSWSKKKNIKIYEVITAQIENSLNSFSSSLSLSLALSRSLSLSLALSKNNRWGSFAWPVQQRHQY
jgi:hypothetical protein